MKLSTLRLHKHQASHTPVRKGLLKELILLRFSFKICAYRKEASTSFHHDHMCFHSPWGKFWGLFWKPGPPTWREYKPPANLMSETLCVFLPISHGSLLVIIRMFSCQAVWFNKHQLCTRIKCNEKSEHNVKANQEEICSCTFVIFHWISSSPIARIRTNKWFFIWSIILNKYTDAFILLYSSVITAINFFLHPHK